MIYVSRYILHSLAGCRYLHVWYLSKYLWQVRKYLKRDDSVCHQNEYHVCSQWYLTFAGMIGFYEVSCTWHPKPCESVLGPNEIKRLLSNLKRAERTISHVSRSTYVKWHLSIIIYIIDIIIGLIYTSSDHFVKKHMNRLSAFFAHPHFPKQKNPWFLPEVLGGRQLLRVWLRFRLLGQWGGHTGHQGVGFEGDKNGAKIWYMFFLLVIWDDFLWFEMTSGYLKWSHHIFGGWSLLKNTLLFVCLSLPKTRLVLQVDLDWFGWVFWNSGWTFRYCNKPAGWQERPVVAAAAPRKMARWAEASSSEDEGKEGSWGREGYGCLMMLFCWMENRMKQDMFSDESRKIYLKRHVGFKFCLVILMTTWMDILCLNISMLVKGLDLFGICARGVAQRRVVRSHTDKKNEQMLEQIKVMKNHMCLGDNLGKIAK